MNRVGGLADANYLFGGQRQRDHEFGTVPQALTERIDRSSVEFDEMLGKRKSDAEAIQRQNPGWVTLLEYREDALHIFRRYSYPVVPHTHHRAVIFNGPPDMKLPAPFTVF